MAISKTKRLGPLLNVFKVCELAGISMDELQGLRIAGRFPWPDVSVCGTQSKWYRSTIDLWKFNRRMAQQQVEVEV
jgi:hypothetical protein